MPQAVVTDSDMLPGTHDHVFPFASKTKPRPHLEKLFFSSTVRLWKEKAVSDLQNDGQHLSSSLQWMIGNQPQMEFHSVLSPDLTRPASPPPSLLPYRRICNGPQVEAAPGSQCDSDTGRHMLEEGGILPVCSLSMQPCWWISRALSDKKRQGSWQHWGGKEIGNGQNQSGDRCFVTSCDSLCFITPA